MKTLFIFISISRKAIFLIFYSLVIKKAVIDDPKINTYMDDNLLHFHHSFAFLNEYVIFLQVTRKSTKNYGPILNECLHSYLSSKIKYQEFELPSETFMLRINFYNENQNKFGMPVIPLVSFFCVMYIRVMGHQ